MSTIQRHGFRSLHRNLQIRLVDGFISMLLGNMLFPFMTIYFAQSFGEEVAGLLLVLNVLIGLLAGFYGGYIADRIGRKRTMVIGETTRLVAFVIMMLANSPWLESPLLTFAMFTLAGVCWGISGPAHEAMMVDVSTPENRKFVYSIQYWAINFSLMLGGVIGGFFFQSYRFELYIGVVIAQTISLLLLLFFIEETHKGQKPAAAADGQKQPGVLRQMIGNYKLVFRDNRFMLYVVASLFLMAVEHMGRAYVGVRLASEFGTQELFSFSVDGVKMFGLLGSENSLLVVLTTALFVAWVSRHTERKMLMLGITCYSVGFAVQAFTNSPWLLFGFMALATVGELIWVPIKQAMMADLAPQENRSAYMAVNGLVYRGAMILGSFSITVGTVLPSWSMGVIFLLSGLLALSLVLRVLDGFRAYQEKKAALA